MFVFSKDVLIHILNKIKIQLNNKVSSEYTVNGQTYHKVLSEVEYNSSESVRKNNSLESTIRLFN